MVGFLWRFALGYGLLIAPWPGFNDAYGRYFRGLGEIVFSTEAGPRQVHFEAVPAALHRVLDTRIALANRTQLDAAGRLPVLYLELDSRGVGWVPTALLLALILATPVPWRRRAGALLGGLLAVHGFMLFSVSMYILNHAAELSLLALTPFWKQVAEGLEETLITQLGAGFVGPVLLWILLTFRREEMAAWARSDQPDIAPGGS